MNSDRIDHMCADSADSAHMMACFSFAASIAFTVAFGELVKKAVHACMHTFTAAEQNDRGSEQVRALAFREAAVLAREAAVAAREAALAVREEAAAVAGREAAAALREGAAARRRPRVTQQKAAGEPQGTAAAPIPAAKEAASASRGVESPHDPPSSQEAAPILPTHAAAGVLDVLIPAAKEVEPLPAPVCPTGAEADTALPCSGLGTRAPPPRASCAAGSTASLRRRMVFRYAARQASSA